MLNEALTELNKALRELGQALDEQSILGLVVAQTLRSKATMNLPIKDLAMKTIAIADQRRSATSEDHAALDCDMRLRNAAEPLARTCLVMEKALRDLKEDAGVLVKQLSKLNIEMHGDLHACDCEGHCGCKPDAWYKLEGLVYHGMSYELSIDEAVAQANKICAGRE